MVLIPIDGTIDGRWINPEHISLIYKAYNSEGEQSNIKTEIFFAGVKNINKIVINSPIQTVLERLK